MTQVPPTNLDSATAAESDPQSRPARFLAGTIACLTALLLLAAVGYALFAYRPVRLPDPPEVDLTGVEPAISAAVRSALAAVKHDRGSAEAWGRLGMVLHVHSFLPAAKPCFAAASALEPREPKWWYLQAMNLLEDDPHPASAVACLRRSVQAGAALSSQQISPVPRLRLAELLLEQGRLDEAEAELSVIRQSEARNPRLLLDSGRLALARGQFQNSAADLTRSADREPRSRATHALLAEAQHRLGHLAEAQKERRLAARCSASFAWPDVYGEEMQQYWVGELAELHRANDSFQAGQTAAAIARVDRLLGEHPESLAAALTLGRFFSQSRQAARAVPVLRAAAELHPESTESHMAVGKALAENREYGDAVASFRRVIALQPDHVAGWHHLARALAAGGDRAAAEQAYRECLRLGPGLAAAHRELGELLLAAGRRAEALECLRRAVALDPDDPLARKRLRDEPAAALP